MLRRLDRGLMIVSWAAAALFVVLLFAGPSLISSSKTTTTGPYGTGPPTSPASSGTQASAGARVFADAGCGGCHTLKAAGANGAIGPNLDQVRPSATTVQAFVRSGGGSMPSFAGTLTAAQIAAVSSYVASVAGR